MDNRCICCGDIIPEGRSVCCSCSLESVDKLMRENDDLIAALQERDTTIAMLKDAHASELAYRKQVAAIGKREIEKTLQDALVLIVRQKDEIKRLEEELVARKEAVREFVERIWELFPSDKNFTTISRLTILQIARELTEDQK